MSKQGMLMRAASIALLLALVVPVAATADTAPAAGAASLSVATVATPGNLRDVQVYAGEDGRPVVTLTGDRRLEYKSFVLKDPYRLVVDLPDVVNRLEQARYAVEDAGVVQVRTAQFRLQPRPVSRVVFDLDHPLAYEIQSHGSELVVSFGNPLDGVESATTADLPAWARQTGPAAEKPSTESPAEVGSLPVPETSAPGPELSEPEAAPAAAPIEAAGEPDTLAAVIEAAASVPAEAPLAEATESAASHSITERKAQGAAAVVAEDSVPAETAPPAPESPSRSIQPDAIERLLHTPPLAAEAAQDEPSRPTLPSSFKTRTIVTEAVTYTGKRISLNLVDADVKQVFRLFHEISGINFVLDPSVSGRVTIVVDNVPWDQALDLILKNNGLDKVLENNVIRIATTQKLANEAAQRKKLKEAKELEVEPITITRTLSYAKAKDVERVIREGGILSQRGKVIVDERTNTLIISDIPKKLQPLDLLISTLDSETPQVMIEARVVETSRDFVQDLGVVWGFSAIADASRGTQTGLPFPNNASVRYGLNLPGAGGASNLAFKFGNIIDSFTLDIALNTLETEGRARVLSSPKIATQNNERAEIEQGVRIPVVNTTATEINVEYVSASLRLEVTPQITAEGTIILDIVVENNTPDFVNRVGDVPPINTQRAQTKVLIGDGGTTVIGGIFTVNEGRSETGVPWFRKVPVFGWLFKTRNITNQNRELLIFITPKIMKLG